MFDWRPRLPDAPLGLAPLFMGLTGDTRQAAVAWLNAARRSRPLSSRRKRASSAFMNARYLTKADDSFSSSSGRARRSWLSLIATVSLSAAAGTKTRKTAAQSSAREQRID